MRALRFLIVALLIADAFWIACEFYPNIPSSLYQNAVLPLLRMIVRLNPLDWNAIHWFLASLVVCALLSLAWATLQIRLSWNAPFPRRKLMPIHRDPAARRSSKSDNVLDAGTKAMLDNGRKRTRGF